MEVDVADVESLEIIEAESQLLGTAKALAEAAQEIARLTQSKYAFLINPRHFDTVAELVTEARRHLLVAKMELQEKNYI